MEEEDGQWQNKQPDSAPAFWERPDDTAGPGRQGRRDAQTIIAIEAGNYSPSLTLAFESKAFNAKIEDVFQYEDTKKEWATKAPRH